MLLLDASVHVLLNLKYLRLPLVFEYHLVNEVHEFVFKVQVALELYVSLAEAALETFTDLGLDLCRLVLFNVVLHPLEMNSKCFSQVLRLIYLNL